MVNRGDVALAGLAADLTDSSHIAARDAARELLETARPGSEAGPSDRGPRDGTAGTPLQEAPGRPETAT